MADILFNLLSEGIGIAITVLLIDRLIKRREKQREEQLWRPATIAVHSTVLTDIVDKFLAEVLPPNLVQRVANSDPWSSIKVAEDAQRDDVGSRVLENLCPPPKDILREVQGLYVPEELLLPENIRVQIGQFVHYLEIPGKVSPIRRRIIEIFDTSGNRLSPELSNMLHKIDQQLLSVTRAVEAAKESGLAASLLSKAWSPAKNTHKSDLEKGLAKREYYSNLIAAPITEAVHQTIHAKAWLEADLSKTGQ